MSTPEETPTSAALALAKARALTAATDPEELVAVTEGDAARASALAATGVEFVLSVRCDGEIRAQALALGAETWKFEPMDAVGGDVRPSARAALAVTLELTLVVGAAQRP